MSANRTRTAARRIDRQLVAAAMLLLISIIGLIAPSGASADSPRPERFKILLFTKTAGFFHPSIPTAIAAIEELGARNGFAVDATTDAGAFTSDNLAQYSALVFVNTTGNVLSEPSQRAALEDYIRDGGGWFGVHAASDMGGAVRDGWPFYRRLVGAAFLGHTRTHVWADAPVAGTVYEGPLAAAPADAESFGATVRYRSWEPALVNIEDVRSPAMRGWGHTEVRVDEWYGFRENPRQNVHVLASLDENSYDTFQGDMGPGAADHPIAWCQAYEGGRSVYTGMGHPAAAWGDSRFLRHVLGGIRMAAGEDRFECAPA